MSGATVLGFNHLLDGAQILRSVDVEGQRAAGHRSLDNQPRLGPPFILIRERNLEPDDHVLAANICMARDTENPIGLNVLDSVASGQSSLVVSSVVSIMRNL